MSLNQISSFNDSAQSNLNIATNNLKIKCVNNDLLSMKPPSKGLAGEVLSSDGGGNVVWAINGGGGGSGNMVYSNPSISASGSHYKSSNTSGLLVDESSLVESNTHFDFQSKNLTTLGTVTSGAFIKTGGTNLNVLLADGSVAPYVTGSSSPNIYLYRNSTDITVPPSITSHIQYNNTIQQNATLIWINHLTNDSPNIDIDAFLSEITATDIIYIQDRSTSLNWIKYNVVSTTVVFNNYTAIVVTYNSGEGTGLTSFGNNHPIFFSVFNNTTAINLRLAQLENKTQYQSALVSNETLFTGDVKATKIIKTPNSPNEYLMSDGSILQGPYSIQSQGTGETLLNDGTGPTFKTKSLKVGTGLSITHTSDEITLTNSMPNNTTLSNVGSGTSLIPVTSANPNFQMKSIQPGTGLSFNEIANNITITNSSPATSITLTNVGTVNSLLGSGVNPSFTTKGLVEGTGMQITSNATDLTLINTSPASGISLNTSGLGDSLINSSTNPNFTLKSLSVSGGLNLVPTSNNLLIQNTSPASSISLTAVGLGDSLIATSTNPNFNIKSLIGSTGINITNNANDLTIVNSSPASLINISSTGVGTSLLKTNANPTYTFKGLSQGTGITVTNQTDDLLLSTNTSLSSEGLGNFSLIGSTSSNPSLKVKSISSGSNITITDVSDVLTINSTGGGGTYTFASGGTGTSLISTTSGLTNFETVSITAGANVALSSSGTDIVISSAGALGTNTINVTSIPSSASTYYPLFSSVISGNLSTISTDGVGLSYIPATNTLTAGGMNSGIFTSNITPPSIGFQGHALSASQIQTTANPVSASIYYPTFVPTSTSATSEVVNKDVGLSYRPSDNKLMTSIFEGTTFTGTGLITTISFVGTATNSTQIQTTANPSSTSLYYPTFVSTSASNNNEVVYKDVGLSYRPSDNAIFCDNVNAITFTSSTAIASAGFVGTSSQALKLAQTAVSSSASIYYPVFSPSSGTSTGEAMAVESGFTYQPSTNTVTATTFVGSLTGTASNVANLAGGTAFSIPYQSAVGTTAFLANGAVNQILTSRGAGLSPQWNNPSALVRGYIASFSSGGTTAGYLYANSGNVGLTNTNVSGVGTKFVVSFAGSIEAMSVVWGTGSATATISIFKGGVSSYTSSALFTSPGTTNITGIFVSVVAGDVIEVRTNNFNLGSMTANLYFT